MKAKEFFEMLEKANEFKTLISELKTEVSVIVYEETLGTATTFEQFKKILDENFNDVSVIINADIRKKYNRQFRIDYIFDNEKCSVDLFVC